RCRRRAEEATRAGRLISLRRIVGVVARAREVLPVRVAVARVRLNAIAAATSQAALAVKTPEGRCANAEALRSACTFSMIAWARWTWSAVTVSRSWGGVVVKKAWKRQVSNSDPCPSLALGVRSGMRRTTRRPVACSDFLREEIGRAACSERVASRGGDGGAGRPPRPSA